MGIELEIKNIMMKFISFVLFLKNWMVPNGRNNKKLGIIIHPKYFIKSSIPANISLFFPSLEIEIISDVPPTTLSNIASVPETSVLYIIIGININRKMIRAGTYVFKISFEILFFNKNNIDIVNTKKIPSERTIVVNDASVNAIITPFLSYLKNIKSDVIPNKIKSGSVIPNVEFKMILGSKANNDAPTKEILLLKNFRHKK